jgi:MFS family permease
MSGVLLTQSYKDYFNEPTSFRQGGITAAMPAGSFFGAMLSSWVADKKSRKTAIQLACLFWITGSL